MVLNGYLNIKKILDKEGAKKALVVGGNTFKSSQFKEYLDELALNYIVYNGYSANPEYQEILNGIKIYKENNCDSIIAFGGGSAIDVAKCIKLFINMDLSVHFSKNNYIAGTMPLIALPTTAGTGSESTRFAVFTDEGVKKSVASNQIIPNYALLEPDFLNTLPMYQKKCTYLDALCQGVESYWAVTSTEESKIYARLAIKSLIENRKAYFNNDESVNYNIMLASNLAGRAINISATTAAHALSYRFTTHHNIPHGHAVAVCLAKIWKYMYKNLDKCADLRGVDYLENNFKEIAEYLGVSPKNAALGFENILADLEMPFPKDISENEIINLTKSVRPEKLLTTPVKLSKEALLEIYENIGRG